MNNNEIKSKNKYLKKEENEVLNEIDNSFLNDLYNNNSNKKSKNLRKKKNTMSSDNDEENISFSSFGKSEIDYEKFIDIDSDEMESLLSYSNVNSILSEK